MTLSILGIYVPTVCSIQISLHIRAAHCATVFITTFSPLDFIPKHTVWTFFSAMHLPHLSVLAALASCSIPAAAYVPHQSRDQGKCKKTTVAIL
jgi:hypothetical protein